MDLYFKALPEGTMCFKDEKLSGVKKAKERLTALLTANMNGSDKRKHFVIGKSAKPRCFKGVKSLPVVHKANKNAWMTAQLFEDWLKDFDREMDKNNRKVCLLLDNCSAHYVDTSNLKATELVFLPPNTTSVIQPLDQGIIRNFKHYYRSSMLQKVIGKIDSDDSLTAREVAKNINVLDAVHDISSAWKRVGAETIQNCFFPRINTRG